MSKKSTKYKSQQLYFDHSIKIDYDETYNCRDLNYFVSESLGIKSSDTKEVVYKKNCIIPINITYLGNPHPLYKKRIQVGKSIKKIIDVYLNKNYNIIILGVYNYKGLTMFVNFDYESYKNTSFNNSSFHVYINDLYMALKNNIFKKIDKKGNKITVIHSRYFKKYLDSLNNNDLVENNLLSLFDRFNENFKFNEWIYIFNALPKLYTTYGQFRQGEWQGFYLENEFHLFITENQLEHIIKYTANSNKVIGQFDFDLYFVKENFFGDLKASDINKNIVIGNDAESVANCINKYGKLWYIVYEHETKLDKNMSEEDYKETGILENQYITKEEHMDYLGTRYRTNYIAEKDNRQNVKPLSYKSRLKYGVNFKKMKILEFNLVNYRDELSEFNQGRQPTGEKRKCKVKFNKKYLDNDNIVIYRYSKEIRKR